MRAGRVFQAREVVWTVPELGISQLRAPSMAVERVLSSYYADSEADAHAFVDALLSHTLIAPRLSYDDVAALPPDVRAALRTAVAEAADLPLVHGPGTRPAATDVALLAAMRDRFDRLARDLQQARDPARFLFAPAQRFIDGLRDVEERVHAGLRGRDPTELLNQWLARISELGEWARIYAEFVEAQPLGFIIMEMRAGEGLELLVDAEEQGEHVVADVVERALIRDDGFLGRVDDAIEAAASLDDPHRDELREAMDALHAGKPWAVPCGQLLGGVEGMLWRAAEREGVIDDKRNLLKTADGGRRAPRIARNVNQLLDERVGFERVGSHLRRFLDDVLYDGVGHHHRHRRAQSESHREYACWGFVGLCGWLDRTERKGLMLHAGRLLDEALAPTTPHA
jgi:hypothetical protein